VIALLALALERPRATPALTQVAVVLAVASLSALAGGHTDTATARGAAQSTTAHTLYCRLL
jgi:hypothetical protein